MPCHRTSGDLGNSESRSAILLMPGNTSHRFNAAAAERCERENNIRLVFIFPYSPFRHKRGQSNPSLKPHLKPRRGNKIKKKKKDGLKMRLSASWIRGDRVQGWQDRPGSAWQRDRAASFSRLKRADVLNMDFGSPIFNVFKSPQSEK